MPHRLYYFPNKNAKETKYYENVNFFKILLTEDAEFDIICINYRGILPLK